MTTPQHGHIASPHDREGRLYPTSHGLFMREHELSRFHSKGADLDEADLTKQ
jgi:hypothetical protein